MPRLAVSPAASEQDFDILGSIVPDALPLKVNGKSNGRGAEQSRIDVDEKDDDAEFIAAQQTAANRKTYKTSGASNKKSRAFQTFGLNAALLKAITRKGFSVPTPIQRRTIPLILDNQDVVGMARTGSGKTAAFVIPMIERLKSHSVKVGARAIIISPSRELALQTLKSVKEFGRGTDLRSVLLVGGDSIEGQFAQMASNPDIIVATPGRFMHLLVEMSLDLSSVRYAVFDEADRLFEMGFSVQLTELLHGLPATRQTLLFSATLPKTLVDFAKAGLREPQLVRLDSDTKISPDLQSAFLLLKQAEKEGALLHLLQDIVKMPLAIEQRREKHSEASEGNEKKRKRDRITTAASVSPTRHSTIIFTATKHHVEYISTFLQVSGFSVSYVYGSLDQNARKMQVENFRAGATNVLVVTDVAARGIDMPMLANVINYDFPSQPKIYVHRVGRTARAGQQGWSYSLIQDSDLPYLLDLQLFLGKRLVIGRQPSGQVHFAADLVLGSIPRRQMEMAGEIATRTLDQNEELVTLRSVAAKGEKLYSRTRNSASNESAKRAKSLSFDEHIRESNMLYGPDPDAAVAEQQQMLVRISGLRPAETVFEIGKRGKGSDISQTMRKRKERLNRSQRSTEENTAASQVDEDLIQTSALGSHEALGESELGDSHDMESDDELEVTFPQPDLDRDESKGEAWQDKDHFMSYHPRDVNVAEDRGYGVHTGSYNSAKDSDFAKAANSLAMDLNQDESKAFAEPSKARGMRWDKKSKKYVSLANDQDGSKGGKMISSESGQRIAASFRSGRFETWKKSHKLDRLPRTGETEMAHQKLGTGPHGGYKHQTTRAPKTPDKYRDDYFKKKKRIVEKAEAEKGNWPLLKRSTASTDLKGVDDIRKQRNLRVKRREKNARPSRKRKL